MLCVSLKRVATDEEKPGFHSVANTGEIAAFSLLWLGAPDPWHARGEGGTYWRVTGSSGR